MMVQQKLSMTEASIDSEDKKNVGVNNKYHISWNDWNGCPSYNKFCWPVVYGQQEGGEENTSALREMGCDLKCKKMYVIATCTALPSWEEFAVSPSNSMMTGTGMMMVRWRLLMTETSIDSEDKRMLMSMTSTTYPGMME